MTRPSPLDPELFGQLKELESGSPGFLKDIIEQFLRQAVEQIGILRELTRARDGDGVHRAAHLLKGSAGSIGALGLMELLRGLEAAGQKRAWTDAEGLLPRVDVEFDLVKAALAAAQAEVE